MGQKTSLVNFEHKIMTSANYTDGIVTGYTSHDKELCLHNKKLLKNQSIKLDVYWCYDETYRGGEKLWFFHPKRS